MPPIVLPTVDIFAACVGLIKSFAKACAASQCLTHVLMQVAAAPAARGAAVQNIAELENEDQYHLPVDDQDREINLSLLTACLCAADQVGRVCVQWPASTAARTTHRQRCFVLGTPAQQHSAVRMPS